MDIFEELLQLQNEFQQKYKERFNYTRFLVSVALFVEAVELMGATEFKDGKTFKWWSNKPLKTREERVEELADMLHFFLLYMLEDNVTVIELFEAYKKKLAENYRRQESGTY